MITITNIRNLHPNTHDESYVIVRSLKFPIQGAHQLAVLSPSTNLFYKYLNLQKQGHWNEQTFNDIYVPDFLAQIRNDKNALQVLTNLVAKDKAGSDIALACFCSNETLCHRSIIAGMLYNMGAAIQTDEGRLYEHFTL